MGLQSNRTQHGHSNMTTGSNEGGGLLDVPLPHR